MATVQEPPRTATRHEAYVAAQIDRAARRVRGHDLATATLGLGAGILGYALVMVLLDRWLVLPLLARQAACGFAITAGVAYVAIILSRPFRRTVNPYYAARQVERAVPGAKNSVVNWLDLHERDLPPAIHQALSHRAARDLDHADIDTAVRDPRLPWLTFAACGLALFALVLMLILRPGPFLSLLGRNLAPFAFSATDIARQTSLEIVQPAGGDVTVSLHRSVEFRVAVSGRVPSPDAADAVRLQWKYNPADPIWEEQRFEPTARDPGEFALRIPTAKVQNGFVYRVAGGDSVTPEHRVSVRSTPLIESFEATYRYRPYLRFQDETRASPNLEGLRGTHVTLVATTNRAVKAGGLHLVAGAAKADPAAGKAAEVVSIPGELVPDRPNALRFQFVLEKSGHYTITFATTEDEENDREHLIPYKVNVLSDQPPQIDVTRPAADKLPVNAALEVEGKAADDFGLTAMRLCLQYKTDAKADKPQRLTPLTYRPGRSFQFPNGTFPRSLDYKDVLPLDQLKTELGGKVEAKAGIVLEYWLEAEDNYDYPKPNVGRSKVYTVTLVDAPPQPPEEKQAHDQQVKQDKSAHDKQQDEALQKEAQGKQENPQAGAQDGANPPQDPMGDPQGKPPEDPLVKTAREIKERLQQERNQQGGDKQEKDGKGEGKGAQPNAGEGATDPQKSPPGEAKPEQQGQQPPPPGQQCEKCEGKGEGNPDQLQKPGAAKPGGGSQGTQSQPNPGQPANPMDTKPGQPQPDGTQGCVKPQPQDGGDNAGQPKPQPQGGAQQQQPGEAKENPQPGSGQQQNQTAPNQPQPGAHQPNPGANPQQPSGQNPDGSKPQANDQKGNNTTQQQTPKPGGESKQPPGGAQTPSGGSKGGGQDKAGGGGGSKSGGQDKAGGGGGGGAKSGGQDKAGGGSSGGSKTGGQEKSGGQSGGSKAGGQDKAAGGSSGGSKTGGQEKSGGQSGGSKAGGQDEAGGAGSKTGGQDKAGGGQGGGDKAASQQGGKDGAGGKAAGSGASKGEKPGDAPKNATGRDAKADQKGAQDNQNNQGGNTSSGQPSPNQPGQGDQQGSAESATGNAMPEPGAPKPTDPTGKGTAKGDGTGQGDPTAEPPGAPKPDAQARGQKPGEGQSTNAGEGQKSGGNDAPRANEQNAGQSGTKPGAGEFKEPTRQEMDAIAKDLVSDDAQTRRNAQERLARIEEGRAQAERQRRDGSQPGQGAETGTGQKPSDQPGGNQPSRQPGAGEAKSKPGTPTDPPQPGVRGPGEPAAPANQPPTDQAKAGQPSTGQPNQKARQPGQGEGQRSPNGTGNTKGQFDPNAKQAGGAATGAPSATDRLPGAGSSDAQSEDGPGSKVSSDHAARAGELQLEDFKKVDKKLLDEMNMTQAEWDAFQKAYADRLKQKSTDPATGKANRQRGAADGKSAANTRARRVTDGTGKAGDVERGGAARPPSEYRDPYRAFTEDLSKSPHGPPKKDGK